MEIKVTFDRGEWVTEPQLAIVWKGEKVRWVFRAPSLNVEELVWKIEFKAKSPFGVEKKSLSAMTRLVDGVQFEKANAELLARLDLSDETALNHRGATAYYSADEPGYFKYDISVQNISGEIIGDEDPVMIVITCIIGNAGFAEGYAIPY